MGKVLAEISSCIEAIRNLELINEVERFGIRYINGFEYSIFDYANLKVELADSKLTKQNTFLKTTFERDGFISLLQMGEGVMIGKGKNKPFLGSVIDIDTSITGKKSLSGFLAKPPCVRIVVVSTETNSNNYWGREKV